jgi:hypothetical protein
MTWRIDRNAVVVREARGILSRRLRCQGGHRYHLGERLQFEVESVED